MTRATDRRRRAASALMALALAGGTLTAALTAAPAAHADDWRDKEYWLAESGITKAWEVSKGANVKVAVIDSGVDGKHPDLAGVLAGRRRCLRCRERGRPEEHRGKARARNPCRHHAGGPRAPARGVDGKAQPQSAGPTVGPDGIVGVAPEAQLLSVSTWLGSPNPGGKSDQDQIPQAVRWAVDNGARVINISLGSTSPEWPQSWDAAFLYAEQNDVVIVAAAGNRGGGNVQVGAPATIPGVLTVAGLDRKGTASIDSSSQGISIGVAAPAENLIGGLPGGGYAEWAGTSGATPIVAGVAALIRSKWPEMTASQVINRIVSTAKDAGAPGKDPLYGFGILNAEAALKADVPETRVNPLGSISDWIRVHRRGNLATTPAASRGGPLQRGAHPSGGHCPGRGGPVRAGQRRAGHGGARLRRTVPVHRGSRRLPAPPCGADGPEGRPRRPRKPGNRSARFGGFHRETVVSEVFHKVRYSWGMASSPQLQDRPRVLVVGGGYVGLYVALKLQKKIANAGGIVTLVDPLPYMTYQPFLPEVAGGNIEARHAVVSHRKHLKQTELIQGRVTSIDHANRTAVVAPADGGATFEVPYFDVVVAAGAITRTFPIKGLADKGIGLKTIEEAVALRNGVLERIEAGSLMTDPVERARALTFVVVGGGFAGIECITEMEDLARAAVKNNPRIKQEEVRFVLVEAMGRIMPEVTASQAEWVVEHLRSRGIEVLLNTSLDNAEGSLKLINLPDKTPAQEFESDTLVWTAGVQANPMIRSTDFPLEPRGRVRVLPDLRIAGRRRHHRQRLGGRRHCGRAGPHGQRPAGRHLRPERPARPAPGQAPRQEPVGLPLGQAAQGLQAQEPGRRRRLRRMEGCGQPQHRRPDRPQGPPRLAGTPRLPRPGHADRGTQAPRDLRLDPGVLRRPRHHPAGRPGQPPRRFRGRRDAGPQAGCGSGRAFG